MKRKVCTFIALSLLSLMAWAQETVLEVIPLYNRPASEVQPLIESLLDYSDKVLADGSNLIVSTTPDRLAEIKQLINQLDTPINNLIITVLQSRSSSADELNAAARAHVHADDASRFSGRIAGHVYQTQGQNTDENSQTLRTLEGNTAYIKTGNMHPVENVNIDMPFYGYPSISSQTQFIEASTGFAVTPRLAGDQVILEVSPWSDRMNARGQLQTQGAQSTLRINLGEWVELGGIDESNDSSGYGTLSRTRQTRQDRLRILVKVDKTP